MESSRVAQASRRVATFDSLKHRNFRLLWIGMVIVGVGMWMQTVAQGWLVLELTNSPFYLGLVGFMRAVPGLAFAIFGGVMADRMDRRKLMVINACLFMLFSFILGALVLTGSVQVWHVLVLAFLSATVSTMDQPARQAMVPALVPKEMLMNAISLNSAAQHGPRVFGPSIAGLLIPFIGTSGCFFITGLSYTALIATLLMMQVPAFVSIARKSSAWGNLVEGLGYIRGNRTILGLMMMAGFSSFFGVQYPNLLPVFAKDVLGVGAMGLGLLFTASGCGALICTLGLASLSNFRKKGLLTVSAVVVFTVGVICLSLSRWFLVDLLIIFVTGGTFSIFMSLNNTIVQMASPDHMRGRVMGLFTLTGTGMTPMGSLMAGSVAGVAGAPFAVGIGAVIVLIAIIAVNAKVPKIRHLE